MSLYFNELDPYPAQWLKNLFPHSEVDVRSIANVRATETAKYLRCHFFAGIGGWELALRLASEDDLVLYEHTKATITSRQWTSRREAKSHD